MFQDEARFGRISDTLDSLVLPQVNSECMQIFIDEIASRHPDDNVVMVLDGAGWHKCKDFRSAYPTICACCSCHRIRPN